MRKFKTLVGVALCMVLLLGGVLPNLSTVHADETDSQVETKQLNLKIADDKAHVTIRRVDEKGDILYTGLERKDLPKNAMVRIALPQSVNGRYNVSSVDVERAGGQKVSYDYNNLPESIDIYNEDIVNIIYEPTQQDFYSFDVTYYDYDYSCSSGDGINAESNYPASEESQRLQMGVRDYYHQGILSVSGSDGSNVQYGSLLGPTMYVVNVDMTRPDGSRVVAGANVNHGVDDTTDGWGIDNTANGVGAHELWPIVTNLVTGLDGNGNPVWGKTADGKQLVDPGFFTNTTAGIKGKHIYTSDNLTGGASLDYERNGYHYVLKRANVGGNYTNVKIEGTSGEEITNPRFFPLDQVASATPEQMFVDPWHDDARGGEDYDPHNWYFAIRQEFTFKVGQYEGPLTYTFEGDDDVWVFLDNELVLDLGGLHCVYPGAYTGAGHAGYETAWPNTVDIRKLIEDPNDLGWRDEEHKITILYMERGGYDSNCYMEFTLPIAAVPPLQAVIDIPAKVEIIGMEEAVEDGNFNPDTNGEVTVRLIDKSTESSDYPSVIEEQKVSVTTGSGEVVFLDVPLEDGLEYTVIANKIPDFAGPGLTGNISDGFTLTYEYQPDTRDITIQKVWDASTITAGKNGDAVSVQLLADGENYGEPVMLDKEHNWQTTVQDLRVRKNGKEIAYTIEEVNVPEYITHSITGNMVDGFVITNSMKAAHKVTYEFVSGTPDMELPESVTKYLWNDTIAIKGEKVSAGKPEVTSVDVGSGFWEFQQWDNTQEVTVTDEDVHFTGTWNYREKRMYSVTYVFESGSEGQELPEEVINFTPRTPKEALEGDVLSPTQPDETKVDVYEESDRTHPIGYWTFVNWDTTNLVVREDVTFTGIWEYAEYPTYDVTYEFYSDTEEYPELPEEVRNTKPYDRVVHQGESIQPTKPSQTRVEVSDGVWTFVEYDETKTEESVTIDRDTTFHGKWHFEPRQEYPVSYIYKSGTPGKDLPPEVISQTPETVMAVEGTEVIPQNPRTQELKTDDGVWKFYGYDKPLVIVDGQEDEFTGIWILVPDYQITYRFESGTEGYDLPDAIQTFLPESTTASEGETVTPEQPASLTFEDKQNGGVWQFEKWNPEELTVDADAEFVGTWTFTKWNVTYEFVSGTAGRNLPPGVVDYLPKPTVAPIGSTISAQIPEVTRVETPEGYWDFERYDKNDAVVTADLKFTGTWRYTAKPTYKVAYSFVSGTEGRALPKEVLEVIPRTVEGLKNNTVVSPAQPRSSSVSVSGGIWKFVSWDKTSLTVNGRDATFIGTWTFTANTTNNNNNSSNNNNSNNNNTGTNNNKPANTTNPVSPKTGQNTMAGTCATATLAMVAGALVYYKKKEYRAE